MIKGRSACPSAAHSAPSIALLASMPPFLLRRHVLPLVPLPLVLLLLLALVGCGGPRPSPREINVWTLDLAPRFNPYMPRLVRHFGLHAGNLPGFGPNLLPLGFRELAREIAIR